MANRYRGEVTAVLDGRQWTLCLTLGALAELDRAQALAPDFQRVSEVLAEVLARQGDLSGAAAAERAAARARAVDQNQARFVPF